MVTKPIMYTSFIRFDLIMGDFMVNYRILDKSGNVLYQGTTNNLERRIREYENRGLPDGWTLETD